MRPFNEPTGFWILERSPGFQVLFQRLLAGHGVILDQQLRLGQINTTEARSRAVM
jgi:hypothetical protein